MSHPSRKHVLWLAAITVGLVGFSLLAPRAARAKDTSGPVVRVVYIVPSDRTYRGDYAVAIESAIEQLQAWYQREMGNGKTFTLNKPVVEVIQSPHPTSYYSTNPADSDVSLWFWSNVTSEVVATLGGMFFDPNNIWVIYID